jgi:hypothetical protein
MSDEPGGGRAETGAPEGGAPEADEPISDLTLAEVLDAAAEDLADVEVETDGTSTTWSAGGHPFAALEGEWAEFRLDPLVARAALRTPETARSPRGLDWVTFSPLTLDDPAIDRIEAWFLSAYRQAIAPRH